VTLRSMQSRLQSLEHVLEQALAPAGAAAAHP